MKLYPQVNDLVLNNNHSLTCSCRQLYLIKPQVNDLVLNNSLTHLYETVVSDNASS